MYPEELTGAARNSVRGKNPSQTVLKRGISPASHASARLSGGAGGSAPRKYAAYYALFHTACRDGADLFIGALESSLDEDAWNQIYRAFDHRHMVKACRNSAMKRFPPEIREFARVFVEMREKRIAADYDPSSHFIKSRVLSDIDDVERVIRTFKSAPASHDSARHEGGAGGNLPPKKCEKDRRAFAAFILLKIRAP